MAKARPIEGLAADAEFAQAAARVVAVRAAELVEHSAGVLEVGDIERVHDMRVASRRLRAALEVFAACFPKKLHRAVLRDVKALADALGERRDRDVTIAFLEGLRPSLAAANRAGIDSFLGVLREEQAAANMDLAPAASRERLDELTAALEGLVAAAPTAGAATMPEHDGAGPLGPDVAAA